MLTAKMALSIAPLDAYTQVNFGFTRLDQAAYADARTHFQMALRTNPNLEEARLGLKEVEKAKWGWYRQYRRALVWINQSNEGKGVLLAVAVCLGMGFAGIANSMPPGTAVPLLTFGVFAYIGLLLNFYFLLYVGDLLLLLRPATRTLLLSRDKWRAGANAIFNLSYLGCCISYLLTEHSIALAGLVFTVSLHIPLHSAFRSTGARNRSVVVLILFLIALASMCAIIFQTNARPLFLAYATVYGIWFIQSTPKKSANNQ
jgi:hypothetical protein